MSVTIFDIAAQLDLSPSTVSRSLRQSARVHPHTRAQVAALAAELGYQGRSRRGPVGERGRTRVGLVLRSEQSHDSPNAVRCLQGLTAEADAEGALLSVHAARRFDKSDDSVVTLPDAIEHGECDVLVLEGRHDVAFVAKLASRTPLVSLDWIYDAVAHDTAQADNVAGIHAMIDHLHALGHRRLAWVDLWYEASFATERHAAFIQRCLHHDLPLSPATMVARRDYGGVDRLPTQRVCDVVADGCTGVVCVNDQVAGWVVQALQARGLRVPADASVTGFDAMPSTASLHGYALQLTTVDPQFVEVGRAAMALATRRAAQPGAGHLRVSVRARPVIGQTTGPAPH